MPTAECPCRQGLDSLKYMLPARCPFHISFPAVLLAKQQQQQAEGAGGKDALGLEPALETARYTGASTALGSRDAPTSGGLQLAGYRLLAGVLSLPQTQLWLGGGAADPVLELVAAHSGACFAW